MFINRFGQGFSGQLLKNPKQMAKYISSFFLKISMKISNLPVKKGDFNPQILRTTQEINIHPPGAPPNVLELQG